jgi:hypothetical protein
MTLNRLDETFFRLAMSEWVARSALSDILKEDFSQLNEDRLYRNMDRLYSKRGPIEAALCAKGKSLFSLQESILLYDLTSTYLEGLCLSNPKAKARLFARFAARLQTDGRRTGARRRGFSQSIALCGAKAGHKGSRYTPEARAPLSGRHGEVG